MVEEDKSSVGMQSIESKILFLIVPALHNIELDGGLTSNIVKELNKVSINRFAGWSIISDKNPKNILSNALEVEKIII